jgi:pimeloyl-ACP methyl ester carboxylesterase
MLPTLTVKQGRIKVDSTGALLSEVGVGEAIISVHGLCSDGHAMLERLAPLGGQFRILAPDLPGFGGSDKPRGFLYSPDGYAAFVVRLARLLKLSRYAVVGAGAGRVIAARIARKDAERVACAAAIEEPRSLLVAVRLLANSRAPRKLVETLVRGRGGWREFVPLYARSAELSDALLKAFSNHATPAAEEGVDEQAEQDRAEELELKAKARRKLRVIS